MKTADIVQSGDASMKRKMSGYGEKATDITEKKEDRMEYGVWQVMEKDAAFGMSIYEKFQADLTKNLEWA